MESYIGGGGGRSIFVRPFSGVNIILKYGRPLLFRARYYEADFPAMPVNKNSQVYKYLYEQIFRKTSVHLSFF